MWEKHLKKKVRNGPTSLLKISLSDSSISAIANQRPDFSVSGTSTPNGLFQTINGLKKYWVNWNGSINNLELLLTFKASYFLFFTCVKILRSTMTWKENLPHINKFFSSPFSSTSAVIRMPKWVHMWPQVDNEVSTWFP